MLQQAILQLLLHTPATEICCPTAMLCRCAGAAHDHTAAVPGQSAVHAVFRLRSKLSDVLVCWCTLQMLTSQCPWALLHGQCYTGTTQLKCCHNLRSGCPYSLDANCMMPACSHLLFFSLVQGALWGKVLEYLCLPQQELQPVLCPGRLQDRRGDRSFQHSRHWR